VPLCFYKLHKEINCHVSNFGSKPMKKFSVAVLSGACLMALVSAPAFAAGDAAVGEGLYKKKCKVCHATEAGKNKAGPSLAGIVGSKAASTDYAKYSGLKGSDVVWDEKNLVAFLTNPKKFVVAKTMIVKVKDANDRANIIEYLKTLK